MIKMAEKVDGKLFEGENNLEVQLPASFFVDMLTHINIRTGVNGGVPLATMEFFSDKARVRTYSMGGNEYIHVEATNKNMEIRKPGYLIVVVSDFLTAMRKFNGNIIIRWNNNDKIHIYDSVDSRLHVEFTPKSLSEIPDVPAESKLFYRDQKTGKFVFPTYEQRGNDIVWIKDKNGNNVMDVCSTRAFVSSQELAKGLFDMSIAGANYVIYNFSQSGSFASSGKFYKKGNTSSTPIVADVEGPDVEINMPNVIKDILSFFKETQIEIDYDKRYDMAYIAKEKTTEDGVFKAVYGVMGYNPELK